MLKATHRPSRAALEWSPYQRPTGSSNTRSGRSSRSIRCSTVQHSHVNGNGSKPAVHQNGAAVLPDAGLLQLMQAVSRGSVAPAEAAEQLAERSSGMQQVSDFALLDSWRANRTGFPEVVWGSGKSPIQIAAIMSKMMENESVVLATRVDPEVAANVQAMLPEVEYNEGAHMLIGRSSSGRRSQPRLPGTVAVISAGTADSSVAEECRVTADFMGCYSFRLQDVSTDGLHRIIQNLPAVRAADVVIVIAGMDGALPSVIAGLVESPVIAVPTSIGYGAAFGGVSPLLSALTAGAPGVCTVNIDNGFGAAMLAARILRVSAGMSRKAAAAAAANGNNN